MANRQLRTTINPTATELVERLLALAARGLPRMYRPETDEFAFTRAPGPGGTIELRGTSTRYAAIVALGAWWLPEPAQRPIFGGRTAREFIGLLIERLPGTTNLGDVALVCWAAAQARHPDLGAALARLAAVDQHHPSALHPDAHPEAEVADGVPQYVVEASWVLAALAAARAQADVEEPLAAARHRLLASRRPGASLFPHATGPGLLPWYRTHVACYADQVYPIQALALLHRSGDDPEALAAASAAADRICQLQGPGGQWWWHYDARTSGLVEGYPVYTVHQHAMGPMALLDLTDAGGGQYREAIERGLRWITEPAELDLSGPPLVLDDEGLTWRKIYRGDPHKVVRAVHGVTTRAVPGLRLPGVNRVYRPAAIDRECRPYEFGWLLYAWLARHAQSPGQPETALVAGVNGDAAAGITASRPGSTTDYRRMR
jgi:hypothetical protein